MNNRYKTALTADRKLSRRTRDHRTWVHPI